MDTGKKIIAALAMLVGAVCIITAWGLLFEGDKSPVIVAVEIGGVVAAIGGYLYWQKLKITGSNKPIK